MQILYILCISIYFFARNVCAFRIPSSSGFSRPSQQEQKFTSDPISPINIDEDALGEYCLVITGDEDCISQENENTSYINGANDFDNGLSISQFIDNSIKYVPIIAPIFAYLTYEEVAKIFRFIIDFISNKNWVAVDGGDFQIKTLIPAINGLVVPTASILFAVLSGTTITTLRQRQLDIRTCLNMEASEIRVLQASLDFYQSSKTIELDFQDKCRAYLIQYTSRLITESRPDAIRSNLEFKGSMDSEMNGFISQLNEMTNIPDSPQSTVSTNPLILSESYGAITRLNSLRATRISALQSSFPKLHFFIVFALGASICLAFLMETNQEILIFLNAVQLRILWSVLIGTLASLAVVCYDLSEPFRGSYQIASSITQLYTIRDALSASDRLKKYQALQNEYNEITASNKEYLSSP